ncbi:hypothetical protein ACJX0J_024492, partial [Zea mays]
YGSTFCARDNNHVAERSLMITILHKIYYHQKTKVKISAQVDPNSIYYNGHTEGARKNSTIHDNIKISITLQNGISYLANWDH